MKARAQELDLAGVRIDTSGDPGRCDLGPTMVIYPEGARSRCRTIEDVETVRQVHVIGGGRVSRLMLRPDDDPPPAGSYQVWSIRTRFMVADRHSRLGARRGVLRGIGQRMAVKGAPDQRDLV